jgi:hypothetical protein
MTLAEQLDQQLEANRRELYKLRTENGALRDHVEELRIACEALIGAHSCGNPDLWDVSRRLANEALRTSEPQSQQKGV